MLGTLLLATLVSCRADSPTAGPSRVDVAVGLRPSLIPSPSNGTALPINRIRAAALRESDEEVVGTAVMDVSPAAESWTVDLSVDAGLPVSVFVTLELVNVDGEGTEEVQFSGRAGPFLIGSAPLAPDVPIARGPLANLSTTSVTIESAPATLPLGASAPLTAVAESESDPPTVFWTSLDPAVLSLDGATATGLGVGTGRVVASAGAHADTVQIEVIDPDSVPPVVVSVDPSADAAGAARSRDVVATFVLLDSLGATVPATVSTSDAAVTLTPDEPLEAEHRYTATLGAGISDLAGNPLGDPYSWSFTTGGLAVLAGSFDPGVGLLVAIAFDEATGEIYVHDDFSDTIRVFDDQGTPLGRTIPRPGLSSNDIDLDFTTAPSTMGATQLPLNTLLVHNGEAPDGTLFAVDKTDGTVLDSMVVSTGGNVVGGAFHARRGTFFAVSWNTDVISEVELQTGAILNSFPVTPAGAPAYDVFYGDIEVDPVSGNIYLVSSSASALRVLTPDGAWIDDYDLAAAGVPTPSGIAWDPELRIAWISSTNGLVYAVEGIGP